MTEDREWPWVLCWGFMAALLGFVGLVQLTGCPPPSPNLENVAAVNQYEALLEHCREQGKLAGAYAVYEACADAVDRELCSVHGLRCQDGGP